MGHVGRGHRIYLAFGVKQSYDSLIFILAELNGVTNAGDPV